MTVHQTDVAVIGAGPVGLFAIFELGMVGLKCHVLDALEAENEIDAQIVKMRFFAGMNNHEIAALLDVNEKTVRPHWNVAKLWLYRALEK